MRLRRRALGAEVGFGGLLVDQLALGGLDRAEHRGFALTGAVDADAEVDLVGTRIGVVELDQREERVGRLLGESFEHGGALMPMLPPARKRRLCVLPPQNGIQRCRLENFM